MLWVNLPLVDTIRPQSNKFVTDVENKPTRISKLNDSPAVEVKFLQYTCKTALVVFV